ncbi:MAG: hypothetical protein LBT46_11395 [Planctomycetaceae bacterium]|nr:hypothetical protein [Planctomycetaceae bacterium]
MFYKLLLLTLLSASLLSSTGCVHAIFSSDPIRRNNQLLNKSEDLRLIQDEWERFWMLDQPSHLTPYRTHGGVI